MIRLNKTLNPEDYKLLAPELQVVDAVFHKESPQHPARRWEYSMALRAGSMFQGIMPAPRVKGKADIGGAGSPFHHMLDGVTVIDPALPLGGETLQAAAARGFVAAQVFCISVIEHVRDEDLQGFLKDLGKVTAPGGLLFLTMDYSDAVAPDTYHFNWMRERIYNPDSLDSLRVDLQALGFKTFGGVDTTVSGPQVYDYTFASMAMVKER